MIWKKTSTGTLQVRTPEGRYVVSPITYGSDYRAGARYRVDIYPTQGHHGWMLCESKKLALQLCRTHMRKGLRESA